MVDAKPSVDDLNDPVTQHMQTDFARLHVDQTVAEALIAAMCGLAVLEQDVDAIAGDVLFAGRELVNRQGIDPLVE